MNWKFYKIGGTTRDPILGLKPKDLDLVAIGGTFAELEQEVIRRGAEIYVVDSNYFTVRCKFPGVGPCDVALARQDGVYSDGRHPDSVSVATSLEQDLSRREFTSSAIAQDVDTGEIIDPHGGVEDTRNRILRCIGNPFKRFDEDRIRILRLIRFSITKGMYIERGTYEAALTFHLKGVSPDRIRDELGKAFRHDTFKTIELLWKFHNLREQVFNGTGIWLKPTTEQP